MARKRKNLQSNYKFIDSALLNDMTFIDYLERFQKLALSIFEWVNLPSSMNARYLEQTLYFDGQATLLKHKDFGFLNTRCSSNGNINIYGLPSKFHCYSYEFHEYRDLFTGLKTDTSEDNECVLVGNNWDFTPTCGSMELFAMRLAEAERVCDVNLKSQKFPLIVAVDEKQRLLMENLYNQYNGNQPFIFGDKKQVGEDSLKAINTGAPYVIDKITEYKKEIWNEALTFLRY